VSIKRANLEVGYIDFSIGSGQTWLISTSNGFYPNYLFRNFSTQLFWRMQKIISFNVNGLRSALKKGLADWLIAQAADWICLQEVRIDSSLVSQYAEMLPGYHGYFFPAEKKGYSGVAIYTRHTPDSVIYGCQSSDFDVEGRVLELQYSDLSIISIYYPSGTTGDVRQAVKEAFMAHTTEYLAHRLNSTPKLVVSGDFNICHLDMDIHNPTKQQKTSGFLPHERQWLSDLLGIGLVDSFRALHPDEPHQYTWWSSRAGARDKNLGWRIDYILMSDSLRPNLQAAHIHADNRQSDHCPISIELEGP
jgi:exodeoxyribonuclease III